MRETDIARQLDELAFSAEPHEVLAAIQGEFAATGRVCPAKVARVLGDRTKSVTMDTADAAAAFQAPDVAK